MDDLKTVKQMVKVILEKDPKARNSDNYLYIQLIEKINARFTMLPFSEVFLLQDDLGIPGFETVRRTRQKIQAECPELRADRHVENMRMINESVFREFAVGG